MSSCDTTGELCTCDVHPTPVGAIVEIMSTGRELEFPSVPAAEEWMAGNAVGYVYEAGQWLHPYTGLPDFQLWPQVSA